MMSTTTANETNERAAIRAWVNAKVDALSNLTDGEGGQREKVRGIATAWAFSHGMLLQTTDKGVVAVNEPSYEGLANHVRNNPKA